ncbi:ABC transporter permease [Stomatohabitans albus]|uniref:ABC transporter permease n=1 Tax=Stomatohabitans albus TaxID=3110766 RepID=UPI00300CC652
MTKLHLRPNALTLGGLILAIVVAFGLIGVVFHPDVPVDVNNRLVGPTPAHIFGTDRFGRDIAIQLLIGAKTAMSVAVTSLAIAGVTGTILGVLAAISKSRVKLVIEPVTDVLLALPTLLLAVVLGAAFTPSTVTATLAIGIAGIPGFIRVAQATTAQVRHKPFVEAAVLSHVSRPRIIIRHILPNIAGPIAVQASVMMGLAILAEASLSYLGLGTPAPTPSWGRMLADAQQYLPTHPIYALWPGLAIGISAYGANLFGDGLRDWLDPRHD